MKLGLFGLFGDTFLHKMKKSRRNVVRSPMNRNTY